MHGKDYEKPTLRYNAWGDALDAEAAENGYKVVTTGWVPGPVIPIFRRTEYIQFHADIGAKNSTAVLYFRLDVAEFHTGPWSPLCAGASMQQVGSELHSEILPFIRTLTITDGQTIAFTFTFKARYLRLMVKGDAGGATLRVKAHV